MNHPGYNASMTSALNDALTARGRNLGIEEWPYGVDSPAKQEQMLKWAEKHKLTYADGGTRCPHWLIRNDSRDIAGRYSKRGSFLYDNRDHSECGRLYDLDHVTLWMHNGKPEVLVSQPYTLQGYHLGNLAALEEQDLKVVIHGHGWYGHGTVCVEIWASDSDLFNIELFVIGFVAVINSQILADNRKISVMCLVVISLGTRIIDTVHATPTQKRVVCVAGRLRCFRS